MSFRTYKLLSVFLIVAGITLGIFIYPNYFNKGIDLINQKFNLHLSHFPDVAFRLGLDLQGGVELLYQADVSQIEERDISTAMEGLKNVLERRINIFGVRESEIKIIGDNRLSIQLPGAKNPEEAAKEIGKTPYLEFKEELAKTARQEIVKQLFPDQSEEIDTDRLCASPDFIFSVISAYGQDPCFGTTPLTGRYLKRAEINFDPNTNEPVVSLEFNEEGAKIFSDLSEKNIGKPLAIYIDFVLLSAPIIQEKIEGGRAQISGKFSVQEAKDLASNLNAGALPVPINLISQKTVGPTLGLISLRQSVRAGMIGFVLVTIFMVGFYRLSGLLASIALLIYVLVVLSLFKIIPVNLSLAGIGGFILSIGMAVDANVLIFSRIKEEKNDGKEFPEAVKEGFFRAWPSIRDSNFTTLLASLILFGVGTSFVKGFATTLMIGILMSMFSAIVITKTFLMGFIKTRLSRIKWIWG